ncbi:MAG TPA: heavy metal-associated domain-containing protein [Candidatus Xenobia bacterium]|nr:heavy metal-associated domain-containing protein [Candidatus Xenobia bacterium]
MRERGGSFVTLIIVVVVILVVTMIALKSYQRSSPPPMPGRAGQPARAVVDNVELTIEGMSSDTDALQVSEAIRRLPGVVSVSVDYASGTARVGYNPNQVQPADFVAAIEKLGFRARY